MSDSVSASVTSAILPENPDLRHLRDEARALVASGESPTHAKALFAVARRYGFASWPKLKAEVDSRRETGQLKTAIDTEDWPAVRGMMTANPALHRAPLGYAKNGPLTWLAECRVPWKPPTADRLELAAWMIAHGSDIHQGGDGPLMRAALMDYRIPMMELLVAHGADVNAVWNGNYPIILAPCETLAPESLRWLLAHGANPAAHPQYGDPLAMLIGTYSRSAEGRHECLNILAENGFALPDTPMMALHRGRLDLLEAHLRQDPALIARQFTRAEIFPPELGMKPDEIFTWTPVEGVTLLHLAIEFDDLATATWLIEQGADVNARAAVDADGFGGHTPLFHSVVGNWTDNGERANLLLQKGADPSVRASLRKEFTENHTFEKEQKSGIYLFRDTTPLLYGSDYPVKNGTSLSAIEAIDKAGGSFLRQR